MKKNIFSLIAYIIIIALIVGLPFTFDKHNELLLQDKYTLYFYISSKVVFGIALIVFVIYGFFNEMARGMYLYVLIATILSQFIPLVIRFGTHFDSFKKAYSPLVLGLSLVIYIAFVGSMLRTNKLQLESDKKYEGKTIEIKEER